MRVIFDTSVTDFDRGGTRRYVDALLPELRASPGVEVHELRMQRAWAWTAWLPRRLRILVHDLLWIRWGAVGSAAQLWPDLYHGAGFKVPVTRRFPISVTIHDDTPWDDPPTARLYNRTYMRRNLTAAEPILAGAITSAQATAEAIAGRLPGLRNRIHVTPWGVDHEVFQPRPAAVAEEVVARLGLPPVYALLVSPYGPRKNQPRMMAALEATARLHPGLGVAIVGRTNPYVASHMPVRELGHVEDSDLAALYSGAAFLLYTSLKEGFGLPVVEAMACGCAVIVSAGTVLENIAADAGLAVAAESIDEIAAACNRLLGDRVLARALGARGVHHAGAYDWGSTARATVAAWRKMT